MLSRGNGEARSLEGFDALYSANSVKNNARIYFITHNENACIL